MRNTTELSKVTTFEAKLGTVLHKWAELMNATGEAERSPSGLEIAQLINAAATLANAAAIDELKAVTRNKR